MYPTTYVYFIDYVHVLYLYARNDHGSSDLYHICSRTARCTCVPGNMWILPMVGRCDGSHDLTLCLFISLLTEQMYPTPLSTGSPFYQDVGS